MMITRQGVYHYCDRCRAIPLPMWLQFVKDYGLTFPVWPDLAQKATVAFRNPGLPSSYVIDRQGVVRLAWTGAISRGMLDKYVTPLLEE